VESTTIAAVNTIFSFPGGRAVPAYFPIQRDFLNYAPEGGLLYRPSEAWQFRGRVATGYGTPQISNLTVTAQGVSGNNSQLASQTNVGIDIGTDWTPDRTVKLSVTGFNAAKTSFYIPLLVVASERFSEAINNFAS
jgi:iron complex outermembrane recepter protein